MSCITKQRIGNQTYLYESVSFRDKDGKPRNKKTSVGKIDPLTGIPIYKQEYLDKMMAMGTPIEIPSTDKVVSTMHMSTSEIAYSLMNTIKEYGSFYLFNTIAEKIGLTKVLSLALPNYWKEIFTLACYLISSDKPFMYCDDWIDSNETLSIQNMSSQRISELLIAFQINERTAFYESWIQHISEQEYIALDITSISSYSELMTECEWGYNRDHENLPQINLCMLLGETSRLPVYQNVYSGSFKDVTTLQNTLDELAAMIPSKNFQIVMDKGFFSTKNINAMLKKPVQYHFLISVPFTHHFAKKQVESERKDIDRIENTILTGDTPIRGIQKTRSWGTNGQYLYTHIYYNPVKELKEKNELYRYVTELKELAKKEPNNKQYQEDFNQYLIIRKSDKVEEGYTINIRENVIENRLQTAGWMVLISNHIESAEEALKIYRTKDVVEKGFCKLKNTLNLHRLRVHSDERMQNKIFIGFIALIIISHIHKVMDAKNLYKKMTIDKMLIKLSKIKVVTINGQRIIRPLTKEQREILKAFDIKEPVG